MPATNFVNNDIRILNDNLLAAIAAGGGITPVARVLTSAAAVASGSVASGANCVFFETSEDFQGTIDGVTATPSFIYPAIQAGLNNTLPAIAYTIVAGTLIIRKLV